ncbi:MAG: tRNA dihydrouridine synthase DusB [Candidatus Marinimicrobia bacterium]|jgi:tRNA-dihydrouridine synthase B|nr:tRNA dihydrouridine synthase DusB [Candidatus Neomarinimicrobiota bacterium]
MQIGSIKIDIPILLAPMAGVTDYPFRVLCKEQGAGVVYSEFVSAHGIIRENAKTWQMIEFTDFERPIGIQIFGDSPEVMGKAARMVVDKFSPDILDINYGCPVPKVTKRGAGSAALRDLCLMDDITTAVVESVSEVPVTVKMRAGWDSKSIVVPEVGPRLEKIGVKAITLHPRTTKERYKGSANWSLIKALKESVSIPVIGNGDVKEPKDVIRMFEKTDCDGVMIGRSALGNPWFFKEAIAIYKGEPLPDSPNINERAEKCLSHLNQMVEFHGERVGINLMRKHYVWYIRGFNGASAIRKALVTASDKDEMVSILETIN